MAYTTAAEAEQVKNREAFAAVFCCMHSEETADGRLCGWIFVKYVIAFALMSRLNSIQRLWGFTKTNGTGSDSGGGAKTHSLECSKNLKAPPRQPVANSSNPPMRILLRQ